MAASTSNAQRCGRDRAGHRYPDFDGLNLTWEALEGVVKHNGL